MLIYFLDDSTTDLTRLELFMKKYVESIGGEDNIESQMFQSGEALIKAYEAAEEKPYLIFLDIFLEGESGVDVAKTLRDIGCNSRFIFATSSKDHMMDAFSVYADGYLRKPYTYGDFKTAVDRLRPRFSKEASTVTVKVDRIDTQISIADIEYFEAGNHVVYIHKTSGELKCSGSLSDIAEQLKGQKAYISCGRSFIINMNFIKEIDKEIITMKSGDEIIIPVRLKAQIKEEFKSFNRK